MNIEFASGIQYEKRVISILTASVLLLSAAGCTLVPDSERQPVRQTGIILQQKDLAHLYHFRFDDIFLYIISKKSPHCEPARKSVRKL